jgi:hypothetical protein
MSDSRDALTTCVGGWPPRRDHGTLITGVCWVTGGTS